MAKSITTRQTGKGTGAAGKAAARGAGSGGRRLQSRNTRYQDSSNPKQIPKKSDSILADARPPLASGDNPSPTSATSSTSPTNANFFSHIRRVLEAVRYPLGSDPPSDDDLDRILGRIDRPQPQPKPLPDICTTRDVVAALHRLADSIERGAVFLQCANAGNIAAMCNAGASGAKLSMDWTGPEYWVLISTFPNACEQTAGRIRCWLGIHDAPRQATFIHEVEKPMCAVRAMIDGLLPGANFRPWPEADRAEGRQARALHGVAAWCRELAEAYERGQGPSVRRVPKPLPELQAMIPAGKGRVRLITALGELYAAKEDGTTPYAMAGKKKGSASAGKGDDLKELARHGLAMHGPSDRRWRLAESCWVG